VTAADVTATRVDMLAMTNHIRATDIRGKTFGLPGRLSAAIRGIPSTPAMSATSR